MWDPVRGFAPPHKDYTLYRFTFAFPLQSSTFYFGTLIFTFGVSTMNLDAGEEVECEWIGLRS